MTILRFPPLNTLSVSSYWLEYLLDAALHAGCDLSDELVKLGVTDEQLETPYARISLKVEDQLLRKALETTADPLFGLHMGELIRPRFLGELGYASMSGNTLGQALDLMIPFQRVTTEFAETAIDREGPLVTLRCRSHVEDITTSRHRIEAFFAAAIVFGRWIAGSRENPVEIRFEHQPPTGDTEPYQAIFRCPVLFGQADNAIVLDGRLLDLPIRDADPEVHYIMRNRLQQALTRYQARDSLLDQVRAEIRHLLNHTIPQVENVADQLEMKPWTLRRRLRAENMDFSTLLEEERKQLAEEWLLHSNHSVSQIAADLGYSEQSAFNRAFKRWFGMAPMAWRESQRQKKNDPQ